MKTRSTKTSRQLTRTDLNAMHRKVIDLTKGSETLCGGGAHLAIEADGTIRAWVHGLNKGDAAVEGYGDTVEDALGSLIAKILVPQPKGAR